MEQEMRWAKAGLRTGTGPTEHGARLTLPMVLAHACSVSGLSAPSCCTFSPVRKSSRVKRNLRRMRNHQGCSLPAPRDARDVPSHQARCGAHPCPLHAHGLPSLAGPPVPRRGHPGDTSQWCLGWWVPGLCSRPGRGAPRSRCGPGARCISPSRRRAEISPVSTRRAGSLWDGGVSAGGVGTQHSPMPPTLSHTPHTYLLCSSWCLGAGGEPWPCAGTRCVSLAA